MRDSATMLIFEKEEHYNTVGDPCESTRFSGDYCGKGSAPTSPVSPCAIVDYPHSL